jgi:hypothetical protein
MPFAVGWTSVGPGCLGAGLLRLSLADYSTAGCCCHMHGSCKLASHDSFCCRAIPPGPLFPWKVFLCMRDVHAIEYGIVFPWFIL